MDGATKQDWAAAASFPVWLEARACPASSLAIPWLLQQAGMASRSVSLP